MMQRWVEAIQRRGDFLQQMDPLSGEFTADKGGYSPAALVLLDYTWRLSGVREQGDSVEWNVRPPARGKASFAAQVHGRAAEVKYDAKGAELRMNGRSIAQVAGVARLTTSPDGTLRDAVGLELAPAEVILRATGRERRFSIKANERLKLG
jgi:hypothetical protein